METAKSKGFKPILNTIFWVAFSCLIGVVVFNTVLSTKSLDLPYKSYLIQSGSMEPTIMTGDVVLIKKAQNYQKNDIVTYHDKEGRVVTHRIIDQTEKYGAKSFVTMGDANQAQDPNELTPENIIGKVILTIPKLGYVLAFTKTKIGIAILIIIPAIIIIFDEFGKLKKEVG